MPPDPRWVTTEGEMDQGNWTDFDGEPVLLVDATDLDNPQPMTFGRGYFFFGQRAPERVPGLSADWLTEIVAGEDYQNACLALGNAFLSTVQDGPGAPDRLQLSLAYNCTEGGKGVRIVRRNQQDIGQKWSYLVVDVAGSSGQPGGDQPTVAKEIWFSTAAELQPSSLAGRHLVGPKPDLVPIDVQAIEERIRLSLPPA